MQWIENRKLRLPSGIQDLKHVGNRIICFCDNLQVIPEFASLGNEIVVRIDDEKRGDFSFKFSVLPCSSIKTFTKANSRLLLR
jgi:hypothetical protein